MRKWLCLTLLLTLLCGAAFAEETPADPFAAEAAEEAAAVEEAPANEDGAAENPQSGVMWTFGVPLKELSSDYVALVNSQHLLTKADEPEDLVRLKGVKQATSATIYLREIAAEALYNLFAAAKNDGYTLFVKSGYRSYGTQATTYANYLARNNNVDDGVVAAPGASEHQTGLSADILNRDYAGRSRMTTDFSETAEGKWLADCCMSFGFIVRYPEGKEDITKIIYEPWHLRYVGREIAGYIYRNDLTLEEFTEQSQAAVAQFLAAGGDADAQIKLEEEQAGRRMESTVLELYGTDGDAEVSLSF